MATARAGGDGARAGFMICVAAGAVVAVLVGDAFTLAWTHSVEKTRWEEDWQADGDRLRLVAARVQGSGAGMEVAAGARRVGNAWQVRPTTTIVDRLVLAASEFADDYTLCDAAGCRPLADILAAPAAAPVEIRPCDSHGAQRPAGARRSSTSVAQ